MKRVMFGIMTMGVSELFRSKQSEGLAGMFKDLIKVEFHVKFGYDRKKIVKDLTNLFGPEFEKEVVFRGVRHYNYGNSNLAVRWHSVKEFVEALIDGEEASHFAVYLSNKKVPNTMEQCDLKYPSMNFMEVDRDLSYQELEESFYRTLFSDIAFTHFKPGNYTAVMEALADEDGDCPKCSSDIVERVSNREQAYLHGSLLSCNSCGLRFNPQEAIESVIFRRPVPFEEVHAFSGDPSLINECPEIKEFISNNRTQKPSRDTGAWAASDGS